ncbi:uncharacterized protein [Glycine max]|uniref:uncharacterized protein n=1 Tax=Glycine max TaxID=3847 RepID=UPI0003DED871|nr:uncharacterized protein LOC102661713 [Glycine max]|eukprot:XP_006590106.1 uncharacterized protein LOC102661713 [Glycine max]
MAASDHAILHDRAHIPTKRSLLELSSQDALLAQNKLLSKQLEALTETLSKLPTQLHARQPSPSSVLQGQWRTHPSNQFNKDQGGPLNRQQQGPSLYDRMMKLEETLAQFMQVSMSNQKSTESAIKNLEVQVGKLAKQLADRPSRSFGANTEKNPKEECKAVMTRSKMKNKYIHSENIIVEGNCSAIIQRILPPKHKDLGSVTILCAIGEVSVGKALINLGANINLIPLSMCWRLGELEIMPTRMTLQLEDRSITRPYGVIEDVLVRVKHLNFPADFVVMDIEEDTYIPLILERPFMATASYVVDMGKKKLEMGIEDQKVSFELFDEERTLLDQNVCLEVKESEEKVLKERTKLDPC